MRNRNYKSLIIKLKEAKERTRQWALGINVEFPAIEQVSQVSKVWKYNLKNIIRSHEKKQKEVNKTK